MQIETFSRHEVLPLMPLLHQWCAKHLIGFPYYYAPPQDQIIHPFDTVYVNEKKSLVVVAKEKSEVIGIAAAVSLESFYLSNNIGNVFTDELMNQFKEKGFQSKEVLYVGYFLMSDQQKQNKQSVLDIFNELVVAAKKWNKKHICYIQVLGDESKLTESPEPYGRILKGFRDSGVVMRDLSWPTLQSDGTMQVQSHDMAFYVFDL